MITCFSGDVPPSRYKFVDLTSADGGALADGLLDVSARFAGRGPFSGDGDKLCHLDEHGTCTIIQISLDPGILMPSAAMPEVRLLSGAVVPVQPQDYEFVGDLREGIAEQLKKPLPTLSLVIGTEKLSDSQMVAELDRDAILSVVFLTQIKALSGHEDGRLRLWSVSPRGDAEPSLTADRGGHGSAVLAVYSDWRACAPAKTSPLN